MSEKPRNDSAVTRLILAGAGAALSSILFSAYVLFPPAGFVFGLLAPFPVIVSRLRHDQGTALVTSLAATALIVAGFGIQTGVLYLAQCGMIALLLPELLIRGYGAARSITWTTAANLLICLLMALAMFFIRGQSAQQLYSLAVSEINTSLAQALAIYEKAGVKGDELLAIKKAMATVADLTIRMYPALVTAILIVISGCNLILIKRFASSIGTKLKIGEFRNFRNPELMIWLLIIAGFAMLTDVAMITTPALNVLMILGLLYFLQGMAVISNMFFRLGPSAVLKVTLYLLLFLQPYVAVLIAAIGVFDLWGDFRTPRQQENL